MSKLQIYSNLTNLKTIEDFSRFCSAFIQDLTGKFNGQLDFVDNIRASGPVTVNFPDGSTVRGISHGLGFTPMGWLTINQTGTGVIYQPAAGTSYGWTTTKIFLQASAGMTAMLYVI